MNRIGKNDGTTRVNHVNSGDPVWPDRCRLFCGSSFKWYAVYNYL
jgi:hypothetical protein